MGFGVSAMSEQFAQSHLTLNTMKGRERERERESEREREREREREAEGLGAQQTIFKHAAVRS